MNYIAEVEKLESILRECERLVVGYSGGVDSTLLSYLAAKVLGESKVTAVIADSPSLARDELADALEIANNLGFQVKVVVTDEFSDENYLQNDSLRCYYCKSSLMDSLEPIAIELGATVALGVNLSDVSDYRPGQRAAKERGARFPLLEAGITKDMVRAIANDFGVPNWDKPAAPCLSSRIPYGTPISIGLLGKVERAERYLRRRGLVEVRVRDFGQLAMVEIGGNESLGSPKEQLEISTELRKIGYDFVSVSLEPLKSGSLNRVIRPKE
ncbi:MAG: ATP-dependent sacrificial sulfur transferase LarE [Actinomycetota bacterium]|nr:ATP-dependent sacrificial sulfur transferase LarE [Actinomycetota bacterium]